jgi:antitoxin component YwqK of YwqJK toxin-antitoxin module
MNKQIEFWESGNIKKTGFYNEFGKQAKWIEYYENGSVYIECEYLNDKRQGLFIRYNENGSLGYIKTVVEEYKDEFGVEFYENGLVKEEWVYENGEFKVINFWDENGIQTLKNKTGTKIEEYYSGLRVEFHYFDGNFIKEVKLNSILFLGFIPNSETEQQKPLQ